MPQPIESSTLRILNSKGQTIGTGFLVSKTLAVTCAHVVSSIGLDSENRIRVQFTGQKQPIYARVPDESLNLDRDVAILELESVPDGIQPLRLVPAASCRPGSDFRSFGYATAAEVQGIHANGKIDGYLPQHKLLQLQSPQANHGLSGAPVFDESRGVVVGLITKGHTELGRNAETTFATPAELLFEICPEIQPSETCPYLGLETFTTETAQFFFGRDVLTEKLVTTLRGGCRFLAVFGPSGSGKSSVVRAGLLPKLANGLFAGWKQVTLRPADNPFAQMKAAGLGSLDSLSERTILFVDQFEELFTLCPDELREKFVGELIAALENSRFLLILSMRNDFYPAFQDKAAPLAQSEHRKTEDVPGTLKRDELTAMIERPAAAVGLALEEGLTELILKDLTLAGEARSSTLPLLEFALTQLWEQRRDGLLTHAAYQSIGGVTGSLARWADEAYSDLPKSDQPLAESLLTSLVHLSDEAQGLPDTRKRRALAELDEPTRHVIKHFADRRLLVTGGETVELVHDALVREWSRLQDWLKQNREQLRVLEAVSEAASAWSDAPTNSDLLVHHGGRLEDALKLQNRLSSQERTYLATCKTTEQRRRRNTIAGVALAISIAVGLLAGWGWTSNQNAADLREQIRKALDAESKAYVSESIARSAEATARSDANARATAQVNAEEQTNIAQNKAKIARAGELAALALNYQTAEPSLSLLLSIEAFRLLDIYQTRDMLMENLIFSTDLSAVITKHKDTVYAVAFSPNGKTVASGSTDKTIILFDVTTHQIIGQPLTGHTDTVIDVVFSPDGKTLASGSYDGSIRLWDVLTQKPIGQPLIKHLANISSLAFSPDGKILASGSYDNTIVLWDVEKHQPISTALKGNSDPIMSVAFSPDGKVLASGDADATITLWDVLTHQPLGDPLIGHSSWVSSVKFSPDGKFLLSGSWDKTVILWDVTTHKPVGKPMTGHNDWVTDVAFSPDGKLLASSSYDGKINLWDATNYQLLGKSLTGHTNFVESISFSPSGKTLASGSADGFVRLWNLDPQDWIASACKIVGRNYTSAEWEQYFPDEEYRATCPQWPLELELTPTP